ncbi:MAG TPA: IPT/TIG domain-containing protein [Acidimicrobiales bacterium]|nr:IPT/TIG domain-containing protein [Acidimicrobiales bacterium]
MSTRTWSSLPALAERGDPKGRVSHCQGTGNEDGSVLVLALLYLVAISLILAALASWVTNDLNNSTKFSSARSLQFAANSATELAIQSIRYTPLLSAGQTLNASPPAYCWGSGLPSELTGVDSVDGVNIEVWCSTVWTPSSGNTRVVTFSACLSGVSASTCAINPTLAAVVAFDDYPPGVSTPNNGVCAVYCGTGLTVESWLWAPQIPTVASINPPSGAVVGNTTITLTGSGFVNGTTVNFVEETGGTPSSANVVLEATGVLFDGPTTISAVVPTVTSGASYFVTVTTPAGTSSYGPIYTYS